MRNVCKAVVFCLLTIVMAGCGNPEAGVDIDAAVSKAVKAQTAPRSASGPTGAHQSAP